MEKKWIRGKDVPFLSKKFLRIMKLITLFFFVGFLHVFSAVHGQASNITLKINNERVTRVLEEIERQSEFRFAFSTELIDVDRKVSVEINNKNIDEALDIVFHGTDIIHLKQGASILLYPKQLNTSRTSLISQQNTVTGIISDANGEPLPGVDVIVKGTLNGVSSDFNGNYSISNVPQGAVLTFSFVGMKTQEIIVNDQATINVKMLDDAFGLDEVVIVGYSTVKKRDLTGSISSITSNDLSKSGSANLAQAVQGKTAGVLITRQNGKPGGGVSVRIRGVGGINNSEPLYVVDGIYGGSLSGLNPNEIESIEILKDASSAAIYGARGANGVVLITTKRGKAGKMQVSYSGSTGFQNVINSGNVKMLNATQYGEVQNTMFRNDGFTEPFGDPNRDPAIFPIPSQLGAGTNWMDEMYDSNVLMQDHLLSFSGGTENHIANISLSYINQDGVYLNTSSEKFNFRINSDHKINKWLKVGNSTSLGNSKTTGRQRTDNKYGDFWRMLMAEPTIPVFNEDGTLAGPPSNFYGPHVHLMQEL